MTVTETQQAEARWQRLEPWYTRMACLDEHVSGGAVVPRMKLLCDTRCPVWEACLRDVMEREAGWGKTARRGVVAGMTPNERYEYVAPGSTVKNGRLCRRCKTAERGGGSPMFCESCTAAQREASRKRYDAEQERAGAYT